MDVQIIYKVKNLCFLYEKLRNGPLLRSIKGDGGKQPVSVRRKGDVGGKGRRCVTAPAHYRRHGSLVVESASGSMGTYQDHL